MATRAKMPTLLLLLGLGLLLVPACGGASTPLPLRPPSPPDGGDGGGDGLDAAVVWADAGCGGGHGPL